MSHTPTTIQNPLIGDEVTFVHTHDSTGGRLTELSIQLQPGGGNQPHFHTAFAETFCAEEGSLALTVDGTVHHLSPGEQMTAPPGVVHRFANPGDTPIRFTVRLEPGHQGFEDMLHILYGLARDGHTNAQSLPRNLSHLGLMGLISDTRLPGPLRLLDGVFRWLGKRAVRRGVYAELRARYRGEG